MKRIFIAVKVSPEDELLKMFSSLKTILRADNITWVDPANIHLTLAFLGDTDEKRITILNRMLSNTCTGFGEFDFNLTGTGVFKNFRDPRVLWAGIRSAERLIQLNKIIAEGLKLNGFVTGEREFKPHLTLGRVKSVRDNENFKSVLEKYRDHHLQVIHVNEVVLFESILTQTSPIYISLGNFSLT